MSTFLAEYGLWLLIALLIVIIIFFLLSGKKGDSAPARPVMPPAAEIKPPVTGRPAEPAATPAPTPDPAPIPAAAPESIVAPKPEKPATLFDTLEPAASPSPTPVAAAPAATPDDLLLLKGVGPKLNALLIELGVTSFAQIAAWTDADLAAVDARLGTFKGRPVRDHWIDQAKYLAAGDTAGFEAKYGKL